ncbi:MAG: type II toxin-antitoxin system VapC family toxin [Chloroflexota bacterium]|nr:type II toxin-antitoxin system VapC family toxin [Chloroflexota bacterium]
MSDTRFLDTNILVRHLVRDNPDQATRATALMEAVADYEIRIRLPDTVVFETIFTLQRVYSIPKVEIADELSTIIDHPGVMLDHKESLLKALTFWRGIDGLSFADCYHLALAADLGLTEIYSFDRKMDSYPGVARVEP